MTTIEERLRIEPDGHVVVLSGKVEYGQGVRTSFARIVADELGIEPERIEVVLGDTDRVPWDMGTFGSMSMRMDGNALRRVAARARRQLLERASARWHVPVDQLEPREGAVHTHDGSKRATFAELLNGRPLTGDVPDDEAVKSKSERTVLGTPAERIEARDIVTGRAQFTGDVRLPGMLFARVLHPPSRGATVAHVDDVAARAMPGVEAVVRHDDFVAVVARREGLARAALAALQVDWNVPAATPSRTLLEAPLRDDPGAEEKLAACAVRIERTFETPHIANAPIGPSVALADVREDHAVIYAGTQRPFALRDQIAEAVGLPVERVRILPQITSGAYGRNSIGDAPLEAAIVSAKLKRPVQVQWSRADELAVGPARPTVHVHIRAGLDRDRALAAWCSEERTQPHTYGGDVPPQIAAMTSGRNAVPHYRIGAGKVLLTIETAPIRTAAFRSLAAAPNTFAIESAIDDLALAAGEDALAFRLRHIDDPRLRRVLETVAKQSDWDARPRGGGRGWGLACTIYHGTYVAEVIEVSVATSGRVRFERAWAAIDAGAVVDPTGLRNQTEGGIQQAASWTLLESLDVRDGRVRNTGWDSYPIATARDAPSEIDVTVIDGDLPFTGAGEPGSVPVAACIANAVFAATGVRVCTLPITPVRVRAGRH